LAKQITAYLSEDGQVHRSQEEAEWCDYGLALRVDIRDFLEQNKIADNDGVLAGMIGKWDLWRLGGYPGWLATLRGAEMPAAPVEIVVPAPALAAVPAPPAVRPAQRASLPEKTDGAPQFRRRVAVVALPSIHHRTIENEFGAEFKLMLFDYANSMQKLESLRQYHKVIVMTRHAHPKTVQILRGIGQEPLQLNGDLESLRETLTEMYLATTA